jgi:organic radical activating enzyme
MFHLKLIRGLSYTGHGISATKKNPVVQTNDKDAAEALTGSGYFQLLEGSGELSAESGKTGHIDKESLESMKTEELKKLAQDMGIDVTGFRKKSDYIKTIAAEEVTPGPEETGSNEIDYGEGSPTMVDLQQ